MPDRMAAWCCELCYHTIPDGNLPGDWDLVWQQAICPECLEKAKTSGIALMDHRSGCFAEGKPDPRAGKIPRWKDTDA